VRRVGGWSLWLGALLLTRSERSPSERWWLRKQKRAFAPGCLLGSCETEGTGLMGAGWLQQAGRP